MLFLKLNFPASPVNTVPCSTKAPLTKEDEHGMTVHERNTQLGQEIWWCPCLEHEKGSGLVPQGAETVGWFTPSCSHLEIPFPPSVSLFLPESPRRFGGLDTPKKPQPLNFWLALIYRIICQVAAFFYFVAQILAITKIILEALMEHWCRSFPQSLQQNHWIPKQFTLSSAFI